MSKHGDRPYRPFELQRIGYTCADNVVWDCIMPLLSGNAWKVLSLFIRQTSGWHKELFQLGHREIGDRLGLAKKTVAAALDELMDDDLPCIRIAVPSDRHTPATYALNLDLTLDEETIEKLARQRGLRILPEAGKPIQPQSGIKIDPLGSGAKSSPLSGVKSIPQVGQKVSRSYIEEKKKKEEENNSAGNAADETDDRATLIAAVESLMTYWTQLTGRRPPRGDDTRLEDEWVVPLNDLLILVDWNVDRAKGLLRDTRQEMLNRKLTPLRPSAVVPVIRGKLEAVVTTSTNGRTNGQQIPVPQPADNGPVIWSR